MILSLLFLLLPTQLAYHFWPSWSFINGVRIDYLSPTLYLTDMLIFLLFLTSHFRVRVPLTIIIFVVLNLLASSSPLVSLYKWFRILEYFWLFKYLVNFNYTLNAIRYSLIGASLLAWLQFLLQHSVGGLFYWLGERSFNIMTPGIAKISVFGQLLLRPYSTLPHPNALAGFLLISAVLLYYLKPKFNLPILIAFITIPITFSRTAILLELFFLVFILNKKILTLVLGICLLFIGYWLLGQGSPSSLPDRLSLIQNSLLLIQQHPILGVGLGSSISAPILQPVHNIYLLMSSELGLPATLFILIFIIKNFKFKIPLIFILLIGLVDHYWLTLHQNILLLIILLSLIIKESCIYQSIATGVPGAIQDQRPQLLSSRTKPTM